MFRFMYLNFFLMRVCAKLVSLYCARVQLFVLVRRFLGCEYKNRILFIALILVIYMMSFAITNTGNYGKHNYFSKAILIHLVWVYFP
jgi:hypothetical protein